MSVIPLTQVKGNCPMGCGPTLSLTEEGVIWCWKQGCPRPSAAHEVLQDNEAEHIVHFGNQTYVVYHPLHERLDNGLVICGIHEMLTGALPYLEFDDGVKYRFTYKDSNWTWEKTDAR